MELNSQILLALLSEKDREEFKRVLSIVSEVYIDQFTREYVDSMKPLKSASYIKSINYSLGQLMKFTGNIPLSKIDYRIAEMFILSVYKRSPMAAVHIFKTIRSAFNKAVLWKYLSENTFMKIKLPKTQKSKPAFISSDELEKILEHSPEHLKDVYRFAFHTGMRAGEVTNLTWKNVDLKSGVIRIGDSDFITKSREVRNIPINHSAFEILSKRIGKVVKIDGFVFEKTYGNIQFSNNKKDKKFTIDYLSKQFKKACRAAEVDENLHLHSLRHSFASNLVNSGVELYTVQKLLGHANIATTQVYSQVKMDTMRDAVNRISVIEAGISLNG